MSGPPLTNIGKLMVHLDPTVMTCRDKYLIKIIHTKNTYLGRDMHQSNESSIKKQSNLCYNYNKIKFGDYVNLFFYCMINSHNIALNIFSLHQRLHVDINTDSELLSIFLT